MRCQHDEGKGSSSYDSGRTTTHHCQRESWGVVFDGANVLLGLSLYF